MSATLRNASPINRTSPLVESSRSISVLDHRVLAAVVMLALGIAWLQVPGRKEMAVRLLKDGEIHRALSTMGPVPEPSKSPRPEDAPGPDAAAPAGDAALASVNRRPFEMLLDHGSDLKAVLAALDEHRGELTADQQGPLFESLGDQALAKSRHSVAAGLYARALEAKPKTALLLKLVATLRAFSKNQQALEVMDHFAAEHPEVPLPAGWDRLKVTMLRETNQSSRAFDLLLGSVPRPFSQSDMSLIETVAAEADRTADAIPLVEAFLSVDPEAAKLLVADFSISTLPSVSKENLAHAASLVTFLEWNDKEERAFALHWKLARLGRRQSVERCLALYDGVDRDVETCDLLESLPAAELDAATHHFLARMQSMLGRRAAALETYQAYLVRQPDDAQALMELGTMLSVAARFKESAGLFQRALALEPDNRLMLHSLGDALISSGRETEALPIYQKLSVDPADAEALERYALLAENLEMPVQLVEALEREIAASPPPCVDLRLNLACTLQQLPDGIHLAIASLEGAVKEFPSTVPLRIKLAQLLLEDCQPDKVAEVLAKDQLAANAHALELLCEAVDNGADPGPARRFFAGHSSARTKTLNDEFSQTRKVLIDGEQPDLDGSQVASAEKEAPRADLRGEAEADLERGETAQAERKMKTYLDRRHGTSAADWNLLGHIYKARGDHEQARNAFEHSLRSLRKPARPAMHTVASRLP